MLREQRFETNVNVSSEVREKTVTDGQSPCAVMINCFDDGTTLGSIECAVKHLGIKLIVVLGHTHCGAVE